MRLKGKEVNNGKELTTGARERAERERIRGTERQKKDRNLKRQ